MMSSLEIIYHPDYLQHETGGHPENKERLQAMMTFLEQRGYLSQVGVVEPRPATPAEISYAHEENFIREMERFARQGGGMWDPDTVVSPASYDVALLAAGGVITAVDRVLEGRTRVAWAMVRPPGHHAEPGRAMGFCLFNNIAIAARHAQKQWNVQKILIVDWDVHHGNGTQAAFWNDPHILYFSTHQMPLYPGTGRVEEVGGPAARGLTVNIPLPPGTGDAGHVYAWEKVLLPLARAFQPELIMVSAGYDAYFADPLAGMQVTLAGFRRLARLVSDIAREYCGGRIVLTLEGGYHLQGLAVTIAGTIAELAFIDDVTLADPLPPPVDNLSHRAVAAADRAWAVQAPLWNLDA